MTAHALEPFHREPKSRLPNSERSLFDYVSFDIWAVVGDFCLADAFPRRPILADSLIEPLAAWTPLPSAPLSSCVPRTCCRTFRGARTAQVQQCVFTGEYERRGLSALLHTDGYSRLFLQSYPGYLGYYRFLDPAIRQLGLHETSTRLFSWEGLCLCALPAVTKLLPNASFVQLTLPSRLQTFTQSTSQLISDTLRGRGAARMVHLEVRFDWDYGHKEEKRKVIFVAQSLRRMIGVNVTFLVHSTLLQVLRIGAEEDFYTWNPSDIYSVLRACPLLEDLELLTVLGPGPPQRDSHAELPIKLTHLIRLRIRDALPRLIALRDLLVAPVLVHVDVDFISPSMGTATTESQMDKWWLETIGIAEFAASWCPPSLLSTCRLATALHFQRDMDERSEARYVPKLWPEFMQISLARSAEILRDPDAYPSEPRFTFTERSTITSTKSYAPAFRATKVPCHPPSWIFHTFWACALNALIAQSGNAYLCSAIKDVVATSDDFRSSPYTWRDLLIALPAVARLYVNGIRGSDHGLIHLVLGLGIRDGRDLGGQILQEIHLPDWDCDADDIPIDTINELWEECLGLRERIVWHY